MVVVVVVRGRGSDVSVVTMLHVMRFVCLRVFIFASEQLTVGFHRETQVGRLLTKQTKVP